MAKTTDKDPQIRPGATGEVYRAQGVQKAGESGEAQGAAPEARRAELSRETAETKVWLKLNLDGSGQAKIDSGCGFLNHMLELFTRHGRFDLELTCRGDVEVDDHHSVEDIAIALGKAFAQALGDCRGISRYGSFLLPMDEALVLTALDISGRCHLSFELEIPAQKVGSFDTELVQEFMIAFCRHLGLTLHLRQLAGANSHHIIEAAYKGLGRALAAAVRIDRRFSGEIPSTKGTIL